MSSWRMRRARAHLDQHELGLGGEAAVEAAREPPFPQATTDVIMPCQLDSSGLSRSARRARGSVTSTYVRMRSRGATRSGWAKKPESRKAIVTPRPAEAARGARSRTRVGRIGRRPCANAGAVRRTSRERLAKRRAQSAQSPLPGRHHGLLARTEELPRSAGVERLPARKRRPSGVAGRQKAHGRGHGRRSVIRGSAPTIIRGRMDLAAHPEGARRAAGSTAGCSTTFAARTRSRAA